MTQPLQRVLSLGLLLLDYVYDEEAARQLWDVRMKMTQLDSIEGHSQQVVL